MFRSCQIIIRELCSLLNYSQFNSYLQTRCCGNISCCVGMCCGAVARCASYDAHLRIYVKLYVHSLVDKLK